jgi:ubiquinone/menaquinone biosynthesis C-methylase UbiE
MADRAGAGVACDIAGKVWNQHGKSISDVEAFIHDNHPMDRLHERAEGLFGLVCSHFPWAVPRPGSVVLEVGSGVGYIIQAALKRVEPSRIIGLDVADGMIQKAKDRLTRDGATDPRIEFVHYDGITIPLPDNSVDFIYSVAALQHIPRLMFYNLLYELKRILKPTGYCSAQTMSFGQLDNYDDSVGFFREEVRGQLANKEFAWVVFYSFEEMFHVLARGIGVKDIYIVEKDGSLWFSFTKTAEQIFHDSLQHPTPLNSLQHPMPLHSLQDPTPLQRSGIRSIVAAKISSLLRQNR